MCYVLYVLFFITSIKQNQNSLHCYHWPVFDSPAFWHISMMRFDRICRVHSVHSSNISADRQGCSCLTFALSHVAISRKKHLQLLLGKILSWHVRHAADYSLTHHAVTKSWLRADGLLSRKKFCSADKQKLTISTGNKLNAATERGWVNKSSAV